MSCFTPAGNFYTFEGCTNLAIPKNLMHKKTLYICIHKNLMYEEAYQRKSQYHRLKTTA